MYGARYLHEISFPWFGVMQLPEQMLTYCQLDPKE